MHRPSRVRSGRFVSRAGLGPQLRLDTGERGDFLAECHAPGWPLTPGSRMVARVTTQLDISIEVAPSELHESLAAMRLCSPQAQQQMQLSLSRLGQLTPIQVYRVGTSMEILDGLKRARAARELCWPKVRVEVHALDAPGAKVRLLRCNEGAGLSELEEAWLVRSLYRDDALSQPQIARLLSRHKSWVCRRLALAEDLSDELTANVRLGLVSATAVRELARLPRGNQD